MKTTSKKKKNLFSIPLKFRGKPFLGLAQLSKILNYYVCMQKYLEPNKHSNQLGKFTFLVRSRMLEVAENYKNNKKISHCPVCEDKGSPDSQPHLFICPSLNNNQVVKKDVKYENLFEDKLEAQLEVSQILQSNFKERKKRLKRKK